MTLPTTDQVQEMLQQKYGLSLFDRKICEQCQGKYCCQHFPCAYIPSEFTALNMDTDMSPEARVMAIVELIRKDKNIAIDMLGCLDHHYGLLNPGTLQPDFLKIVNYDGVLFLRAARKGAKKVVDFQIFLDPTENHPCANWSLKGCSIIDDEKRPYTGKMVVPRAGDEDCIPLADCDTLRSAWGMDLRVQHVLYEAYCLLKNVER